MNRTRMKYWLLTDRSLALRQAEAENTARHHEARAAGYRLEAERIREELVRRQRAGRQRRVG